MAQEGFYSERGWGGSPIRETLEDREEIVLQLLSDRLSGGRLLDVGCGDGCFLRGVSRQLRFDLSGIDGSAEQIKKASAALPTAKFLVQDVLARLPYEPASFDVVYCGEVIEHVLNPDELMDDMMRVLKPGGVLVLTTPNLFAWYNRILVFLGVSPFFVEYSTRDAGMGYGPFKRFKRSSMPVGHLRIFHPSALRDLMGAAGLEKIECSAARFEYFPAWIRRLDQVVSRIWPRGGSILIASGRKPQLSA